MISSTPHTLDLTTLQEAQDGSPIDQVQLNQIMADAAPSPLGDGGATSAPAKENYHVESIIQWLERPHWAATVTSVTGRTSFDLSRAILKTIAHGKLDYFRFLSADFEITLRWNCPKTTFGAAMMVWSYGTNGIATAGDTDMIDSTYLKTFYTLSSSSATILIPWHYPANGFDLTNPALKLGTLYLLPLVPATTVTDTLPAVSGDFYLRLRNISLRTPVPMSIIPQGGAISRFITDAFDARGQNTYRVASEALNLARVHGNDPAIPLSRHNIPLVTPKSRFTSYDDYGRIARFVPMDLSGLIPPSLTASTFWTDVIDQLHSWTRWDAHVKLHLVGTPFHSGRLRVNYLPINDSALSAVMSDDLAMGFSTLWDIQESGILEFDLPYTSSLEFNNPPQLSITVENPLVSPFASVVLPWIVAEVTVSNIRVLGLTADSTAMGAIGQSFLPWTLSSTLVSGNYSVHALESVYHPEHTSDFDGQVLVRTTGRRPSPQLDPDGTLSVFTGPSVFQVANLLFGARSVGTSMSSNRAVPFLQNSAGWRGSVKISIRPTTLVTDLSVSIAWATGTPTANTSTAGTVVAGPQEGIEVIVPYLTPFQFYGVSNAASTWIRVSSLLDPTFSFNLYVSFLDDLEILYPQLRKPA